MMYYSKAETNLTVEDIIKCAKDALDKYFIGYKGGAFKMTRSVPIYCCADKSYSEHNKIISIEQNDNTICLICGDSSDDE